MGDSTDTSNAVFLAPAGTLAPEPGAPPSGPWMPLGQAVRTMDAGEESFLVVLSGPGELVGADAVERAVLIEGIGIYRAEAMVQLEGRTLHISPPD